MNIRISMFCLFVCFYLFGYIIGINKNKENFNNTEAELIDLQRNLQGCEVVVGQCLDDVMEAEYYFKACAEKLNEYIGDN